MLSYSGKYIHHSIVVPLPFPDKLVSAGVIGLTSALMLSKNPKLSITIVAQHMPGDYDILYAVHENRPYIR